MKAPFPFFGGKGHVAEVVWAALGDVDNYVEPFGGSLAVLLARPAPETPRTRFETVNDKDHYITNFWRALAAEPDEVARFADWPVNEADLHARHIWLVTEGSKRLEPMKRDPYFYDVQVAGWWVWGQSSWIGSDWCTGKLQHRLPHLVNARGVHRVSLGSPDTADGVIPRRQGLIEYFRALAKRLRGVRICCGDWRRVVTRGVLHTGKAVGIFLDPPYSQSLRDPGLYAVDDVESADVREWAIKNGTDPRLRVVLAGYEDEHKDRMAEAGWRMWSYIDRASYQGHTRAGRTDIGNQANRRKARLWFSPHCLEQ